MRTHCWNYRLFWLVAIATAAVAGSSLDAADRMVVHEWGTFTCLQDDDGRELTGINIDDEPVPSFVHNLHPYINGGAILTDEIWGYRQKGAPRHHPHVTMRFETPVIYFYPPKDQVSPSVVNVDVRFRGGWITEYYPDAKVDAPGLRDQSGFRFDALTPQTQGSISWTDLKVGTGAEGPKTYDHVWTAPRKVDAASVTTPKGQSEKYLFYRGVANLRAPLRIVRGSKREELRVYSNFDNVLAAGKTLTIPNMWLADIRSGKTTFRPFGPIEVGADPFKQITTLDGNLAGAKEGLDELKKEMHKALVADGLYKNEAAAMLATWDKAYFQSPGVRLFFIVPRGWTDHVLPLSLSAPADIDRVMVARIELVSDEQEKTLAELAKASPSDGKWLGKIRNTPAADRLFSGRSDFGDLGVEIPVDFQLYLKLGRFRNALVTAEERRHAGGNLTRFINTYGLHPFRLPAKPNVNIAQERSEAKESQRREGVAEGGGAR